MASPPLASADRAWRGLALSLTTLTHAAALGGGLLDHDRLLLVRNPPLHSFAGLATLVVEGRVLLRGAGLPVRDHAPLGAFATWLSWQWFRAAPAVQHALGPGLLVAVVAALFALLRAARLSAPLAAVAALALALHPGAADLSGPLGGRDALLAVLVALVAARRVLAASPVAGVAGATAAAFAAGLCAPGYGLLGLVPAGFVQPPAARRSARVSAALGALAALAITRGDGPWWPAFAAVRAGNTASVLGGIVPSATPFVAATAAVLTGFAWAVPVALAALALALAPRTADPTDRALLRTGAAAMLASMLASALAGAASVVGPTGSFALHLGLVLAATGGVRSHAAALARRARPWMLLGFALPAAVTAHRVRGWSDEDAVLRAIVARDPDDPEALLARARLELRRRRLSSATPWCLRYALAQPTTRRADGCLGALAAARGDRRMAVVFLHRWANELGDRRALRAAALELSEALPDPRFGEAFREATGYTLPQRRPGESR